MGLTDKVKAQANQAAQKTQETAQAGKAKYDQAQANRHANAMLQQLGAAVYAERTGRGTAGSQAKIDKMINDISSYERENGLNLTDQPQPAVPQPGSPPDPAGPLSGLGRKLQTGLVRLVVTAGPWHVPPPDGYSLDSGGWAARVHSGGCVAGYL